MREKSVRVLAAALMTGAIGFALAMPAFFGLAPDVDRSLTAPPSSLQRSVHVTASAPSQPFRAEPAVRVPVVRSHSALASIPAASPASRSNPSSRHSTTAGRSKPDTKPAPAPDTRQLVNDTPPAALAPPAPSQPAQSSGNGPGKRKGKGNGNGHDKKNKGTAAKAGPPPVPATTPTPAEEPQTPGVEKGHGNGEGKGHDKGHDQ